MLITKLLSRIVKFKYEDSFFLFFFTFFFSFSIQSQTLVIMFLKVAKTDINVLEFQQLLNLKTGLS